MRQAPKVHIYVNLLQRRNQNGQAVIEYILMLVITISLILAAGRMFTSLDNFLKKYMGNYIECLMAYGELPSLGVSADDLKKHQQGDLKTCDTKFEKFTFGSGRPATSSGTSGSGNNSASNDNKNSTNSANSAGDNASDSEGINSRKKSAQSSQNPYQSGQISKTGQAGTADGASSAKDLSSAKKKLIEGDDDLLGTYSSGGSYDGSSSANKKYKAVTGKLAEELNKKNKNDKNKTPLVKNISEADEEGYRFQPRRTTVTPPEQRNVASAQDSDVSFGFGDFIKWLFVIGIIVGLVVFFGSQFLGISKSEE